ncbi:MAG: TRAP transporter small permease [Devosia sp.]
MTMLNRFLDLMATVFRVAITVILGLMLTINAVNIAWRTLANHAFDWVFPWTMLLFVWMLFLGLYVYMREHRDVVVDVIVARLPAPLRTAIAIAGDLIAIVVMALIIKAAPDLIKLQLGNMEAIELPIYVRSLPLFASAALLILHFGSHVIALLSGAQKAFPHDSHTAINEEGAPE